MKTLTILLTTWVLSFFIFIEVANQDTENDTQQEENLVTRTSKAHEDGNILIISNPTMHGDSIDTRQVDSLIKETTGRP